MENKGGGGEAKPRNTKLQFLLTRAVLSFGSRMTGSIRSRASMRISYCTVLQIGLIKDYYT
jgi:hypothetical protein